MLQAVLILLGLLACLIISRINRSKEIFWKLLFCLILGIAIGTAIGRNTSKSKSYITSSQIHLTNHIVGLPVDTYYLTRNVINIENSIVANLQSSEVINELLLDNNFNYKVLPVARTDPQIQNTS